jgi:hypothetical protein
MRPKPVDRLTDALIDICEEGSPYTAANAAFRVLVFALCSTDPHYRARVMAGFAANLKRCVEDLLDRDLEEQDDTESRTLQ